MRIDQFRRGWFSYILGTGQRPGYISNVQFVLLVKICVKRSNSYSQSMTSNVSGHSTNERGCNLSVKNAWKCSLKHQLREKVGTMLWKTRVRRSLMNQIHRAVGWEARSIETMWDVWACETYMYMSVSTCTPTRHHVRITRVYFACLCGRGLHNYFTVQDFRSGWTLVNVTDPTWRQIRWGTVKWSSAPQSRVSLNFTLVLIDAALRYGTSVRESCAPARFFFVFTLRLENQLEKRERATGLGLLL